MHKQAKPSDTKTRERYGTMASIVGIIVNLVLFLGKLVVGILTASIAIQADAMNNLSDAGSSVISLISFRIAARPADREHPYGHARIDCVASMIVSFLILVIGVEFFSESVMRIANGSDTEFTWTAVLLLTFAILAKLFLYLFYRATGKRIGSDVLRAAAQDSLSDVASTSAVLVSMLVLRWTDWQVDGYMGLAVSVFIVFAGLKILNETKNHILGAPPAPEQLAEIQQIVTASNDILGTHDLIVHNYGPGRCFASLHAEVDGSANVLVVHDVIDRLEQEILDKLGVQCVIHMDPIITDDAIVNDLRESVAEAVAELDDRFSIHDFRFVVGQSHSNLVFDVVVPFELAWSDEEVRSRVSARIKALDPAYRTVLTIDRQ